MSKKPFPEEANQDEIMCYLETGKYEILYALLSKGLNPNMILDPTRKLSMLHFAVGYQSSSDLSIVQILLKHKAQPNIRSRNGTTPVHLAVVWNKPNVLNLLLCNGGNMFATNLKGKSALDIAKDQNLLKCLNVLMFHITKGFSQETVKTSTIHTLSSCFDINSLPCASKLNCHLENIAVKDKKVNEISSLSSSKSSSSVRHIKNITAFKTSIVNSETVFTPSSVHINEIVSLHESSDVKDMIAEITSSMAGIKINHSVCLDNLQINSFNDAFLYEESFGSHSDQTLLDPLNTALIDFSGASCKTLESSSYSSAYTTAEEIQNTNLTGQQVPLTNSEIFEELKALGERPGPITDELRPFYVRKLERLKQEKSACNILTGYPKELQDSLKNPFNTIEMLLLDHELSLDFARPDPKRKWREGTKKSCFNYLFLDPRITKKFSARATEISFCNQFVIFVKSIFYIGKGQSNRPFEHLLDALRAAKNKKGNNETLSPKLLKILSIWEAQLGVVCLRCFQNAIPSEAFTRECCMIEAIDLSNLTNEKRGEAYGKACSWSDEKRRSYGAYLIKRALHLYVNDGERQIRPEDIKTK